MTIITRTPVKYAAIILSYSLAGPAHALVTSPSALQSDDTAIEVKTLIERGKIEPNENKQSFQKARIDLYQLSLTRGLGDLFSFGLDHFARIDMSYFTAAKESVGSQTFYEQDRGTLASVSYGFNIVHEVNFSAGFYINATPLARFNHDKFSLPRIDWLSGGMVSGLRLAPDWTVEHSFHIGSGIPKKQNAYVALRQSLGYRMTSKAILKFGPYAELDVTERFDAGYDEAFSAPGRTDRIRAMKIGIATALDVALPANLYLSGGYVQKLGGYDAPATQAYYLTLGTKF